MQRQIMSFPVTEERGVNANQPSCLFIVDADLPKVRDSPAPERLSEWSV